MLVECKKCATKFDKRECDIKRTKNNFCTKSCAAQFNNLGKQKNPPRIRICKNCGNNFTNIGKRRGTILCKECAERHNTKINYYKSCTILQYHSLPSVKNKHPSWLNAHVRNFARSWNKHLTKLPCQKCGYTFHVELCHIKAIKSFGPEDILGVINSPENLLVLCRNHHWEFDNSILNIVDIPSRD